MITMRNIYILFRIALLVGEGNQNQAFNLMYVLINLMKSKKKIQVIQNQPQLKPSARLSKTISMQTLYRPKPKTIMNNRLKQLRK